MGIVISISRTNQFLERNSDSSLNIFECICTLLALQSHLTGPSKVACSRLKRRTAALFPNLIRNKELLYFYVCTHFCRSLASLDVPLCFFFSPIMFSSYSCSRPSHFNSGTIVKEFLYDYLKRVNNKFLYSVGKNDQRR